MKHIKFIFISFIILACADDTINHKKAANSEILNAKALGESITIYGKSGRSIDQVANYLKVNYQIDYYKDGEKLKALKKYFDFSRRTHTSARANEEISFADIQQLLNEQGFAQGTATYNYLASVSTFFEGGTLTPEQVYNEMVNLRTQIQNDYSIPEPERFGISTVGQLVESNLFPIIDAVNQEGGGSNRVGSRTAS